MRRRARCLPPPDASRPSGTASTPQAAHGIRPFTLGLLGQVTRFADWFHAAALAVLAFLWLVGLMTQVRVHNASEEDMMFVVAMNRLRGAYVDLDPGVEPYFLASPNDDEMGLDRTYSFMRHRAVSHLFGSSGMLITVVTAVLLGLLAGGVVLAMDGSTTVAVVVGIVLVLAHVAVTLAYGFWTYAKAWRDHVPLRRSPDGPQRPPVPGRRTRVAPPQQSSGAPD